MSGLNLHALVRTPIGAVHPDESVLLLQSTGSVNRSGNMVPVYMEPQTVTAQVQNVSDAVLSHADRTSQNDSTRHFYLLATGVQPAGIIRPLARGGDMLQRADGTWWLVVAVPENFANSGWVCVRASLQVIAPDLSASVWTKSEGTP